MWVFGAVAANATPASVDVLNFSFSPQNVTIKQGETVTWVWVAGLHSTTSTALPPIWDSGVHFEGDPAYVRTFDTVGTFPYYCTIHGVSMSGTVTVEAATKTNTTTTLSSSQNPSDVGQSVTFTAAVAVSAGSGAPTGTVNFFDGSTTICLDVAVITQLAQCTTSALSAGSHAMTAVYSGDASFNGSTSPVLMQMVRPAAPPIFSATATSASEVSLSWGAVSGATSYEVVRSSLNAPYSPVLSTGGTAANDTNLSADTTYLYRVRAFAGTVPSAFSATDPATTIIFTDLALSGVTVKGIHIDELRRAINAMRASAGLSTLVFTDHPLDLGTPVKAVHVTELRSALDPARSAILLPAIMYTDSAITAESTIVKAAHPMELRAGTQ